MGGGTAWGPAPAEGSDRLHALELEALRRTAIVEHLEGTVAQAREPDAAVDVFERCDRQKELSLAYGDAIRAKLALLAGGEDAHDGGHGRGA